MVIGKSQIRFMDESPRKIRQVIDLVRQKDPEAALQFLSHVNKEAARGVRKAIASALANARQNPEGRAASLVISKITATEGPTKTGRRWRAAAMGRGVRIRKRETHLSVELEVR